MASNDALISRTVQDARSANTFDDAAMANVIDEIYQIKQRDQGKPNQLKSDYSALTTKLHQEGLLPGLVVTDSSSDSVTVTDASGKVQTLDAETFGSSLAYKPRCHPPLNDGTGPDQNPAKTRCEPHYPYAKQV